MIVKLILDETAELQVRDRVRKFLRLFIEVYFPLAYSNDQLVACVVDKLMDMYEKDITNSGMFAMAWELFVFLNNNNLR